MEDRVLPGSNPSTAMVQGHGRCPDGIALSCYHASGLKRKIPGVWGQSPRKLEEKVSNRIAQHDRQRMCCTSRVNPPRTNKRKKTKKRKTNNK